MQDTNGMYDMWEASSCKNQQYHIRVIHDNKTVKFKIVNDAKQPKLMFSKVNIIPQQDSSSSSDISDRGIPNNNLNVVGSASINNNNSQLVH